MRNKIFSKRILSHNLNFNKNKILVLIVMIIILSQIRKTILKIALIIKLQTIAPSNKSRFKQEVDVLTWVKWL
jgi:hypothetical protein